MAFLVVVPINDLVQIFFESILVITKVVIKSSINQVFICGRGTCYCLIRLLVLTIASSFARIPSKKLDIYQSSRLTISRLSFFFFIRLKDFFLFIGFLFFLITSIYLSNINEELERSFRLGLNGFIKHFILKV